VDPSSQRPTEKAVEKAKGKALEKACRKRDSPLKENKLPANMLQVAT
jgi:hypothetical protein